MHLRYRLAILSLTLVLCTLGAPSRAEVSVSATGGFNTCIPDETSDCADFDFSGAGGIGVFYEVMPKLHLGVDLRMGAYDAHPSQATKERSFTTFHIMATGLWIEPMNPRVNVEGRLGLGYASSTLSVVGVTGSTTGGQSWTSWMGLNLGGAVSMQIVESLPLDLGLGLDLYVQDGGTMCTETTGSTCVDQEDPVNEVLQTVVFARYHL